MRVDADRTVADVSEEAWRFQVGAHQVLRKWLRDRADRPLGLAEYAQYRRIVDVITETISIRGQIEGQVGEDGLWRGRSRLPGA